MASEEHSNSVLFLRLFGFICSVLSDISSWSYCTARPPSSWLFLSLQRFSAFLSRCWAMLVQLMLPLFSLRFRKLYSTKLIWEFQIYKVSTVHLKKMKFERYVVVVVVVVVVWMYCIRSRLYLPFRAVHLCQPCLRRRHVAVAGSVRRSWKWYITRRPQLGRTHLKQMRTVEVAILLTPQLLSREFGAAAVRWLHRHEKAIQSGSHASERNRYTILNNRRAPVR